MPRLQHARVLLIVLLAAICVSIYPAAAALRPPTSKILASSRAAYLSPLPPSRLLARTRAAAQRRREQLQQHGNDALPLAAAPLTFLRKLSPLLLGFLPMLAPPSPYRQASSAVANAATLTTTSTPFTSTTTLAAAVNEVMAKEEDVDMSSVGEGEDGNRLMGRVEPIEKLGKEAEGIFKVSGLEGKGKEEGVIVKIDTEKADNRR